MLAILVVNSTNFPLLSLHGKSILSTPNYFSIKFKIPSISLAKELLGKFGRIKFNQHRHRNSYLGFIAAVKVEEILEQNNILVCADFYSNFQKLKYSGGFRITQNKTVIECVAEILANNNLKISLQNFCTKLYSKKDLWQQLPLESDLDFINRILTGEGIYWRSIANTKSNLEYFAIYDDSVASASYLAPKLISIYPSGSLETKIPDFMGGFKIEKQEKLTPNSIVALDNNKEDPTQFIQEEFSLDSNLEDVKVKVNSGLGLSRKRLANFAKNVGEFYAVSSNVITIHSNLSYLNYGCNCELRIISSCKNLLENAGSCFITEIQHSYEMPDGIENVAIYTNIVKLIPSNKQYKTKLNSNFNTGQNFVASIDCIADFPDNFAYLNNKGEYKANILDALETSEQGFRSNWLPKMQPYPGWHMPLLAKTEALIGHLNNNPNQLFIVGSLANNQNINVVTQKNHLQHVWRTSGFSEFVLDDAKHSLTIRTFNNTNKLTMQDYKDKKGICLKTISGTVKFYAGVNIEKISKNDMSERVSHNKKNIAKENYKLNSKKNINFKIAKNYNLTCLKNIQINSKQDANFTIKDKINSVAKECHLFKTKVGDIVIKSLQGNINIESKNDVKISGKGQGDITIALNGNNSSGFKITKNGEIIIFGEQILFQAKNIIVSGISAKCLTPGVLPIAKNLPEITPELPNNLDCSELKSAKSGKTTTVVVIEDEFEKLANSPFEVLLETKYNIRSSGCQNPITGKLLKSKLGLGQQNIQKLREIVL